MPRPFRERQKGENLFEVFDDDPTAINTRLASLENTVAILDASVSVNSSDILVNASNVTLLFASVNQNASLIDVNASNLALNTASIININASLVQLHASVDANSSAIVVLEASTAAHAASTLIHFTSANYNMFLENPRTLDNVYFFHTKAEVDVQKVVFSITGSTSVTAFISFGSNRDNLSTDLINAGTVVTNTTSGQVITSFDNAVIPASTFVGVRVTAASGLPDELNIHLEN